MQYEIKEKLSIEELVQGRKSFSSRYINKVYLHKKSGSYYLVVDIVVININNTSYWGLAYSPLHGGEQEFIYDILHTRPFYEFLDGRFELVEEE